jgi:excisionase family DNA binding protein
MEQHRILTASPIDPLVEAIAVRVVELLKSGDEPRLLTVAEASKYISRSERSVRQMIADGVLPVMREGRAVRLDRAALDRWIDLRQVRG